MTPATEIDPPAMAPAAEAVAAPAAETVAVDVVDETDQTGWAALPPLGGGGASDLVARAARAGLAEAGLPTPPPARRAASVCVLLCDDARIAALNAQFRGAGRPTNVLSWPSVDYRAPMTAADWAAVLSVAGPENEPGGAAADGPSAHLGDVALALETTAGEAEALGRPLEAHVALLIVHGVLHLCGYRHEAEAEAETMEAAEKRALKRIGIVI